MAKLSILIAPSNKKKVGGNPFAPDMFDYRSSNTFNYFSDLNVERRALIDKLHGALEATDELAPPLNDPAKLEVLRKIYRAPLLSALERYSPSRLYSALDFQGLPTGAQRRLLESGVIFSGMFGILRPDDLIPEYYLPMNATIPGIGGLADYWRPVISPMLNALLTDHIVWDILPVSYRNAWDNQTSYAKRITIRFVNTEGADLDDSTVARIQGKLVAFLVKDASTGWKDVDAWRPPIGFKWSEEFSVTDQGQNEVVLAFVRR